MLETKKRILHLWIMIFILNVVILISCRPDKGKNIPDVSHITAAPEWVNFEGLLCATSADHLDEKMNQFHAERPIFWKLFFERIVPVLHDSMDAGTQFEEVKRFIQDNRIQWLCDTTQQILGDWSDVKANLNQSFKYLQSYFPEKDLPRIYSVISEFGYLPFIFSDEDGRDGVGVSLDMFLGHDFPYRKYVGMSPSFSTYMTRTYNKDHLPMRVFEALIDDYVGYAGGERLIDQMIHNGKKKYILSQLLPTVSDTVIMAYRKEDLQWCDENERNIWAHFLHQDLLYNQDRMTITKHINPGPNAPGMPIEAPGNTATWIGWKIVENYMRRYPETSMSGLISIKDAQNILEKSKYKPSI
jgi:hypothetical protein